MLLAPIVGEPPRDGRRAARRGGARAARRLARARRGRRARASSTCSCRTSGSGARWRGARLGRPLRRPARTACVERVLVEFVSRQPDRAGARRDRPPRRLRRLAGADPRLPRPHRRARVLRERLRVAGAALRRVDPGAGARRGAARGRLPGRLRARAGRRGSTARPTPTSTSWRGAASSEMVAAMQATLERFRRRDGPLLLRAHAARRGAIDRAIELLEERDQVYPHEGAVWLRIDDASATTRTAC